MQREKKIVQLAIAQVNDDRIIIHRSSALYKTKQNRQTGKVFSSCHVQEPTYYSIQHLKFSLNLFF